VRALPARRERGVTYEMEAPRADRGSLVVADQVTKYLRSST